MVLIQSIVYIKMARRDNPGAYRFKPITIYVTGRNLLSRRETTDAQSAQTVYT